MSTLQDAYLQNVQANYRYYCYHVHNFGRNVEVDGYNWYPSKFHRFLCDTIQEFVEKESEFPMGEFLILNTPPQVGKSTTVTECLPSWYKMKHADSGVIVISYGDDLAQRFGRANLDKIKQFGSIFGVKVKKDKATAAEVELKGHKLQMISRGLKSPLTGYTGNLIVMDDPIKNREDADSEKKRDSLWEEFNDSIMTRMGKGSKLVLIMTRWHEDDLAARIMKEFPDRTTVVNIPCEADDEDDPLGRHIGEPICPEIGRDKAWVEDKKRTVASEQGMRTWNALYQGRPTAREGNMLKREWWQYYDYSDFENGVLKMDNMIMSVDAAFKDQAKNDYVAIEVWGKKANRYYLVDCYNVHLDFPNTVRKIKLVKAKYPQITAILIEDKANGTGIIQTLRDQLTGIIAVQPDASKEARVNHVSFAIEAGCVYLPRDKKFTWEFIDQCASFPSGAHDDMVDSMSQALARLIHKRTFRQTMRQARRGDFNIPRRINKAKAIGKGEKIHVI